MFRGGSRGGFSSRRDGFGVGGGGGSVRGRGTGGGRGIRGGERGRGGGGFTRGRGTFVPRGGHGGSLDAQNTRVTFDDETATRPAATSTPSTAPSTTLGMTKMQVVTNEHGSEVPQRLNNKVFIDGLPYEYKPEPGKACLEEELTQFVQDWKVGKVMRLIKRDGQGFGYLAFRSPNSVEVAVRVLNGRKFLGRALRVEVPKPRDLERMNDVAAMKDHGKTSFARQVLLSDLAKSSQPEIIREILRDVAPQLEEKIETIKMTSNNRKAFLTLSSEGDVEPAVRFLNGYSMLGRNISAQQALAPGSLPYSKVTTPAARNVTSDNDAQHQQDTTTSLNKKTSFEDEDDDDLLIPLGAQPIATDATKKTLLARTTPGSTPSAAKQTKYNLLEKGAADIYVGNLPEDITSEQVRKHFSACGVIKSCEVLVNPATRQSMGIAKIIFALPGYAKYAQENLHGSRLAGATLRVDRGDEANADPISSTTVVSMNDDDEIDEDALLKHHGIRNKEAYFRGTSVAEDVVPQRSSKLAGQEVASKKRVRDEPERKASSSRHNMEQGMARGSAVADDDDDEDALPFGAEDDSDDEVFEDMDVPKRSKKNKFKAAGNNVKKSAPKMSRGNTVDF